MTGKNSGNNLGPGSPTLHFHQHRGTRLDVRLILKGGGCENVGAQYSLPDTRIGANRDLDGVRKAILDAVLQAQGKGCSPGILGNRFSSPPEMPSEKDCWCLAWLMWERGPSYWLVVAAHPQS